MTMADIVDAHHGKELQQQPQVTYLVQKENDMEAILWQLYEAKFMPQISYQGGRIAWLCLEVNNHKFIIKNQNLSSSAIDGLIEVDDEGVTR